MQEIAKKMDLLSAQKNAALRTVKGEAARGANNDDKVHAARAVAIPPDDNKLVRVIVPARADHKSGLIGACGKTAHKADVPPDKTKEGNINVLGVGENPMPPTRRAGPPTRQRRLT